MAIKVFIVEDDKALRESLSILIDGAEGFSLSGVAPDAETALHAIPQALPDVALMDINLPKLSGIECIKILKPTVQATQFVMLTAYSDDSLIFEALASGASGYLLKRTSPAEIINSIQEVHNGGSPMSGQIARKVVQSFRGNDGDKNAPAGDKTKLSARENQILLYLSKGYRYKEIAEELSISTETVRTHLRRIYEKLQVRSGTEAVVRFLNREKKSS